MSHVEMPVHRSDAGPADVRDCQKLFADFSTQTHDAPLYSALASGIAEDPRLAGLLLAAPSSQRLPVLLFAAVHWLLLGDRSEPLARYYPNLTEPALPAAEALPAFRELCVSHADELAGLLATRRTQTNEIGRTALFVPAFGAIAAEAGPLAHVDVGASAGLNLLIDHYDFAYLPGGELVSGSTVTISCSTRGAVPVPRVHPPVAAAIGVDAEPVDVADPHQARWLEACVWPDQVHRFARLSAAIEIANRVGVDVRRGDACDATGELVAEAAAAGHPIVTTSWVLNYLTTEARRRFVAALDRAAEAQDLSLVCAESPALCPELPGMPAPKPGGDQPTAVVVVRWRDGRRNAEHVADAHPHGRWMHWR
jgi:hypothetical protein